MSRSLSHDAVILTEILIHIKVPSLEYLPHQRTHLVI